MFKNCKERLKNKEKVQNVQIQESKKIYSNLNPNSNILSVSCGDGIWDYILVNNFKDKIKKLICTDIVPNPIEKEIYNEMKKQVNLEFIKVDKDRQTKFESNSFDLIYHHDVIEHTRKPYNLISENLRLLKKVVFFFYTKFASAFKYFKIIFRKAKISNKIGHNEIIGDYIHEKEYFIEDIRILMEEIGFKEIEIYTKLFGLMNFQMFYNYKSNSFLEQMGHIIFCKAVK